MVALSDGRVIQAVALPYRLVVPYWMRTFVTWAEGLTWADTVSRVVERLLRAPVTATAAHRQTADEVASRITCPVTS